MKKFSEIEKIGITIIAIDLIICSFMLTSSGNKMAFFISGMFSNMIAIIFDLYYITKSKKKIINIISLVILILVAAAYLIYGIYKII